MTKLFDNGWPKHRVGNLNYSAHNEGAHNGATTWLVKQYLDPADDRRYRECIFSSTATDELAAVHQAISMNRWA